jgi:hypothetical protein
MGFLSTADELKIGNPAITYYVEISRILKRRPYEHTNFPFTFVHVVWLCWALLPDTVEGSQVPDVVVCAPFPLWVVVHVVTDPPFLNAMAFDVGYIAIAAVATIMTAAITNVVVFINLICIRF